MSSLGIRFQRSPVTESVTGEPPLRLPTMPADAVIAGHQFTQGLEGCRFVARRAGFFARRWPLPVFSRKAAQFHRRSRESDDKLAHRPFPAGIRR